MIRFLHAADLHIDSPLRGLEAYEGAPVDRLRGATRQALVGLVNLAIARQVAFVILAGDVYDGNWTDFRTGLFFREQMQRLCRASIKVFVVKGNHDAESQITKQLPALEGMHVFSSQKSETVDLEELGVAIHGRSFPQRAVPEDLVPLYPAARPGRFNIGVLHTSLTGRAGHDPYAPTTVEALVDKGYDYFALGHVHAREVVREAHPRIVFPGNLQGRHARETGPKGCEIVTIEGGAIASAEFEALDVVRWHVLQLDASGLADVNGLAQRFLVQARERFADAREHLHAVRLVVHGESNLHTVEAREPGTVAAAIQAACQDFDETDLWIEQVRLELRSPIDREAAAVRPDAIGEVVRLVGEIGVDDERLGAWCSDRLSVLGALPGALAEIDPRQYDPATLRALLADAEASVLAQLSGVDTDGDGR